MSDPARILVVLPTWVGDAVMATPLLRALRAAHPAAELVGLGGRGVCGVLEEVPWLDRLVAYRGGRNKHWARLRTARGLSGSRFDVALLLPNSLSTALSAIAAGAERRIGYRKKLRSVLLTDPVDFQTGDDGHPLSTLEAYLRLGAAMGIATEDRRMELQASPRDAQLADALWAALGLPADKPAVVLNTGGAYGPAKRWPPEQAAQLARRVHDDLGLAVVAHCGPAERDEARELVRLADRPGVVSMADCAELPFGLSRGVLARARCVVSTDSGPRHMAVALGTPTVSLFGATDPRATELGASNETILFNRLPCGPCWKRTCPLGHHDCMTSLTAERVLAAVERHVHRPRSAVA